MNKPFLAPEQLGGEKISMKKIAYLWRKVHGYFSLAHYGEMLYLLRGAHKITKEQLNYSSFGIWHKGRMAAGVFLHIEEI